MNRPIAHSRGEKPCGGCRIPDLLPSHSLRTTQRARAKSTNEAVRSFIETNDRSNQQTATGLPGTMLKQRRRAGSYAKNPASTTTRPILSLLMELFDGIRS